ncbi:hypothetical protein N7507_000400 [Penicillium longicatenatum]|nr:hypothetical protein N7507_000400 [Penicillium longicatenatum]
MPLLWEPTVMYRGRRWKEHWPWTGKVFSGFISAKKSDYTGLLAQATGELLDGDNACWHCQQGMRTFYGILSDAPWDMAPLPPCQFSMVRYQEGTHQMLSSYSKDLRAMKDDVLAKLMSLRKLIERSGEHWQNADESNPEHADPPVPTVDMLTLTDIYHRELKGSWMRSHGKYLREILTTVGSVKDGVVELVNRLEALIANR